MSQGIRHIAILIPARNESALLPACIRSLRNAQSRLPPEITSDIVVVSDCSTDDTASIAAAELGSDGAVVISTSGRVGVARSLAAEVALKRFHGDPENLWLANTDADGEVPGTWLVDQLSLARAGAIAVAGIIDVINFDDHGDEVAGRFRASYDRGRDGSHPHVHGANLGARADYYMRAGGWSPLASGEDHDLWDRLKILAPDAVRSDNRLVVVTSGRRVGRAPHGFADALAAHNEDTDHI